VSPNSPGNAIVGFDANLFDYSSQEQPLDLEEMTQRKGITTLSDLFNFLLFVFFFLSLDVIVFSSSLHVAHN
jgi:hypothetical protein